MSRTPPPVRVPEDSDASELTYLHALYIAFWKPLYFALGFGQGLLCGALVKQFSDDPSEYAIGLCFMLSAAATYFELSFLERAAGWSDEPILDLSHRVTWLAAGGFLLGIALLIFSLVGESKSREHQREAEAASERERVARGNFERTLQKQLEGVDIEKLRAAQGQHP